MGLHKGLAEYTLRPTQDRARSSTKRKDQSVARFKTASSYIMGRKTVKEPLDLPEHALNRDQIALGLEGSANKLGVGVIRHSKAGAVDILSNIRHTYITPPGEGFLPRDTAKHHKDWVLQVVRDAMKVAGINFTDLDCICFTKGESSRLLVRYANCLNRTWHGRTFANSRLSGQNSVSHVWQTASRRQSLRRP